VNLLSAVWWDGRVKQWQEIRWLWVPDDLHLGNLGRCLALAEMPSRTIVEQGELIV